MEIIEIPFGAKDSELQEWTYTIPEGMKAEIKNGKVIIKRKESEDDRMIGVIRLALTDVPEERFTTEGTSLSKVLAWLEKQKINTEGDFGRGYDCGYEACLNSHGAEFFEKQKEQKDFQARVKQRMEYLWDKLPDANRVNEGNCTPEEWKTLGAYMELEMNFDKDSEEQKEQKPAESISRLTVQGKEVYKICPHCKSRMIRDDSKVYTSMPPQYGYNCPKCGTTEFDTVMYDNPEMEEQKPEDWSNEDEHRCKDAIYFLETAKMHYIDTSEIELTIDWLKSLRPQPKVILKEKDAWCCSVAWACVRDSEVYTEEEKEYIKKFLYRCNPVSHPQDGIYQAAKHDLAIKFMNYLDENKPEGKMCLSNGECEDIDKAFKENDWAKIIRYAEKYQIQPEKLTWEDAQNLWIISRQVGSELDSAKDTFPKWGSSSREMFEEILRRFYKKKEK